LSNIFDFLRAFFPEEDEVIYLRALKPTDAELSEHNRPVMFRATRIDLAEDREGINWLQELNRQRGIYFIPNSGGDCDSEINRFNAFFCERDDLSINEQHGLLDAAPLPTSIRVETAKSVHAYWLIEDSCTETQWREVQLRLIAYFEGDRSIKNPSRLMRLPGYDHLSVNDDGTLRRKPVECVQSEPKRRYTVEEMLRVFPEPIKSKPHSKRKEPAPIHKGSIPEGERNATLASIAGKLRSRGIGEEAIFAALRVENEQRCVPPLDEDEVREIARSIAKYEPSQTEGLNSTYQVTPDGFCHLKPTRDGNIPIRLTNFTAAIVSDIAEVDGVETRRVFELEATLKKRTNRFSVSATQFIAMNWPIETLGTGAVIYPNQKDHARCAIQEASSNVQEQSVFTHTGWREVDGKWVYLHGGGAISEDGAAQGIAVKLPSDLSHFVLPDPPKGDELVRAIKASIGMLDVMSSSITFPLLAAIYRAPLGICFFSEHISGNTGQGKSQMTALAQQHFGAGFDAEHLPASWSSTANAIEHQGFTAKDAILAIDDFAPNGRTSDVQRLHREADRILRAQGNHSGRQRMRADATLRPTKPPRCMFISTGEDVPAGQSLRARLLILEVGPNVMDWDRLTLAQENARNGLYAQAMAGYLRWLAPFYEEIQAGLKNRLAEMREFATGKGMHKRLPDIIANLAVGLDYFLRFAAESGALTKADADRLWEEGWRSIGAAAAAQAQYQVASDPVAVFLDLLQAAVASGQAHVASKSGGAPENAKAWGWRDVNYEKVPQGKRIGWVEGEDLYLEPTAAMSVVQSLGN
jgi:primase-like protein